MDFTVEKVKHLAYLTKVALTDEEAAEIVKDFERTMEWMKTLTEADTSGIEPLYSVMEITPDLRDDKVTEGGIAGIIVESAPDKDGTFFAVPKVVE